LRVGFGAVGVTMLWHAVQGTGRNVVCRSERQDGGGDEGLPREVYGSRVSDDACAEPGSLPMPAMCQVPVP
jgi:hypothetical protein